MATLDWLNMETDSAHLLVLETAVREAATDTMDDFMMKIRTSLMNIAKRACVQLRFPTV